VTDKVLGSTTLYLSFSEFSTAAGLAIAQGASVAQIAALGTYNDVTNTIESPLAGICLR